MNGKGLNTFVDKKIAQIKNRMANFVTRFLLENVDDSKKLQEVKGTLFADEVKEALEHVQNFGFSSNCPSGGEGLGISVNGNRDHTVIILIDHRDHRPKDLKSGESIQYNAFGDFIKIQDDGTIKIKCVVLDRDWETHI